MKGLVIWRKEDRGLFFLRLIFFFFFLTNREVLLFGAWAVKEAKPEDGIT